MGKWKLVPVFAVFLLLFGCSNGAYEEHLAKGKEYMEKQDMKNAISELEKALVESPGDEDADLLLTASKSKYYAESVKNGDTAFAEYEYDKAVKFYKVAVDLDFKPKTDDSSEDPKDAIRSRIVEAQGKIEKQKVLDEYVIWTKTQFDNAQLSIDSWRKVTDDLSTSLATKSKAIPAAKPIFLKLRENTDTNYSAVSKKGSTLEPSLARVHKNMEAIFTDIHKNLIETIKEIDTQTASKRFETERITGLASVVYDYANNMSSFYEDLKSFANGQGLGLKTNLLKSQDSFNVGGGSGEEKKPEDKTAGKPNEQTKPEVKPEVKPETKK